ncbi:MAG: helix-turn-helix domain-containing protein [Gaiellaceae bacterium]
MNLTVQEAARRAGRTPETIRRWIWSGRLPAEKIGNQYFVAEEALAALLPPPPAGDGLEPVEVGGAWGEWLAAAARFQEQLRAEGRRLPSAAELLADDRRRRRSSSSTRRR